MKKIICLPFLLFILFSCEGESDKILFSSNRNGNSDIFLMDNYGKNQKTLTKTKYEEWGPTWINKNEISFLRQKGDSIFRIKLNLKTKEETILKHPSNCILDDKNVLYSPTSKLQLYSCNKNIFIYNPENKSVKNITIKLNGNARYPSWTNDGNGIIFTSNHLGTNQLFLYEVKTNKNIQLTNSDSNNERGELSPDKKLLVYSSDFFEKGNQEIVLKNLKTGELKNISKSPGFELIARFSKDGKKLYYGTNKDNNWEIYMFNLETENQSRLTNNSEFDGDPRILKTNY